MVYTTNIIITSVFDVIYLMNQSGNYKKISFLDFVWDYKFQLVGYIIGISAATFIILYMFGGVPSELRVLDQTAEGSTTTAISTDTLSPTVQSAPALITRGQPVAQLTQGELPVKIIIDKIDVNTRIYNPVSTNPQSLDNELLKGAVRYPGSGTLGHGNMFIFAHSSHLRVINNQAYKAFNNIEDLDIGDKIRIQSNGKEYVYKVFSVALADSEEVWVDLKSTKNIVTLSTCDVFGKKQDRFVVQAVFENSTTIK
jgi:LPXTG-site transpeptidase (sortase) family protein